jgi:hypothetical protein
MIFVNSFQVTQFHEQSVSQTYGFTEGFQGSSAKVSPDSGLSTLRLWRWFFSSSQVPFPG